VTHTTGLAFYRASAAAGVKATAFMVCGSVHAGDSMAPEADLIGAETIDTIRAFAASRL